MRSSWWLRVANSFKSDLNRKLSLSLPPRLHTPYLEVTSADTNLVLGVAKAAAKIKVVVACAGTQPAPVLRHFGLATPPLALPVRPFPVAVEYAPLDVSTPAGSYSGSATDFLRDHIVPAVVRAVTRNTEGHAVVFLATQAEVAAAESLLLQVDTLPVQVVLVAMYSTSSPDQQVRHVVTLQLLWLWNRGTAQHSVQNACPLHEVRLAVPPWFSPSIPSSHPPGGNNDL